MYVEKRVEGEHGRDYIEKISESDRKNKINSLGSLAHENAFGELVHIDERGEFPVICMHGGSMWLCRECKNETLRKQKDILFQNFDKIREELE